MRTSPSREVLFVVWDGPGRKVASALPPSDLHRILCGRRRGGGESAISGGIEEEGKDVYGKNFAKKKETGLHRSLVLL